MQDEPLTGFHTRMSAACPFLGTRDPPLDIKPDWVDQEARAPQPVRVKLERPRSFSHLASGDASAVIDLCEPSPKKRAVGHDDVVAPGVGEGARGSTDPAPDQDRNTDGHAGVPPCASQVNPVLEHELELLMNELALDEDVIATIGDEVRQDPSLIGNLRNIVDEHSNLLNEEQGSD